MQDQQQNPYSTPEAIVADIESELRLGGRGERLVAAIVDGLIMIAIVMPAMFFSGYFSGILAGREPPVLAQVLWTLGAFAIFILVQGYPLARSGQTWGKKLLKLRIVDLSGAKPDLLRLIGFRYGSTQLISLVPVLGTIYAFVDVLFIFAADRRCLHDHIAGTRVVVAD